MILISNPKDTLKFCNQFDFTIRLVLIALILLQMFNIYGPNKWHYTYLAYSSVILFDNITDAAVYEVRNSYVNSYSYY